MTIDFYVTAMGIEEQKVTIAYSDTKNTQHTDAEGNSYYLPYLENDNLYVAENVLTNLLGWQIKYEDQFLGMMCDPTVYEIAQSQVIQLDTEGQVVEDTLSDEVIDVEIETPEPEPLPIPTDKDMIAPEDEHENDNPYSKPTSQETEDMGFPDGWFDGLDGNGDMNSGYTGGTDIDWN